MSLLFWLVFALVAGAAYAVFTGLAAPVQRAEFWPPRPTPGRRSLRLCGEIVAMRRKVRTDVGSYAGVGGGHR